MLVIRNDSILYEFYNHKIADTTLLPSFSVAKSYVSTMVAMAKEEGKIKSYDEPITNYLPELLDRDIAIQKYHHTACTGYAQWNQEFRELF